MHRSCGPRLPRPSSSARRARMFDLGTSFVASVARDPKALAIVDGDLRLTYAEWYRKISSVAVALDAFGLRRGDHIVTILQNRWEAATLHWACQFAGVVITPLNWRAKSDELDYCIENCAARALFYEAISSEAARQSERAHSLPRVSLDCAEKGEMDFAGLASQSARDAEPRVGADALSLMLY